MSGFANPFAQFSGASSASEELVTTSYLTGLPDPRQISDQQVALIFKQVLRRDVRTKQRALNEFENWLDAQAGAVDETIHLAYVQVYAKLALDNTAEIRAKAHTVLGKLYKVLGKASSKFLKYSVGAWMTARFDPEEQVVQACQKSLDMVFPQDRQQMLLEKLQNSVREYIYDACVQATPQNLSDIRLFSPEEINQKYTRLVKCCLDALTAFPSVLFDLQSEEIAELAEGRLWTFMASTDPMLARSAIRLASAQLDNIVPWLDTLWQGLLKACRKRTGSGTGVALEIMQLMNVLTKKHPEVWENSRSDSFSALAQFIPCDPPHSSRFWPLLYNLVLMVPKLDAQELVVLYKPMDKVVVHQLRYNFELEESAWGCFVSLCGKMGGKYVTKAFVAAEQRCHGPSVPVAAIAKFLARLADGAQDFVPTQLKPDVPFDYVQIIVSTKKFADLINTSVIPQYILNKEIEKIGLLVSIDPDLKVPTLTKKDEISHEKGWIDIAVKSNTANSQTIVDALAEESPLLILQAAQGLKQQGVKVDLNRYVTEHLDDEAVLAAAVGAHSTGFVTDTIARLALSQFVKTGLADYDKLREVTRLVKQNSEFTDAALTLDPLLAQDLEILAAEDRSGVIRSLSNLHLNTGEATAASTSFNIHDWDFTVPAENCVNVLRAPVPVTNGSFEEGIVNCEALAETVLATDTPQSTLAIVESYLKSWFLVLPASDRSDMPMSAELLALAPFDPELDSLWRYLGGESALAYHAAQAIALYGLSESAKYTRSHFTKPSLQGAVLAYYSVAVGDVHYDQMQRTLVKEALAGRLAENEYMLIDRKFLGALSSTLQVDDTRSASLVVKIINTFKERCQNLPELASSSADWSVEAAALLALSSTQTDLETVLEIASSLPESGSGLDEACARKCLALTNELVKSGEVSAEMMDLMSDTLDFQALLNRDDLVEIPWLCLVLPEVSGHLELNLEGPLTASSVVSWLLLMQTAADKRPEVSDASWQQLWRWISTNLDLSVECDVETIPEVPPVKLTQLIPVMLYHLARQYPNELRTWYRDLRDKNFVKQLDQLFSTRITPAVMSQLKNALEQTPPAAVAEQDEVKLAISEKQREIRAAREIEDEFTVEIVVSLPEQFPCKPASIAIHNLAGVSEAKKRGWLLEARHHVQDSGVEAALVSVLTRLNNFLEGVEPCAICYMTVNDQNKLPNKSCSNCHNIYHSECLYKWFTTNTNNRLCPMCRSPM